MLLSPPPYPGNSLKFKAAPFPPPIPCSFFPLSPDSPLRAQMQGGCKAVGKGSMTESLADFWIYFHLPTPIQFCFSRNQQTEEQDSKPTQSGKHKRR